MKSPYSYKPKFKRNGTTRVQRDTYGTKDEWRDICRVVKERDAYTCQGKGCGCTERNRLQVHHIKPLSKGDKTVTLNLITLCDKCHEKRHKHMR